MLDTIYAFFAQLRPHHDPHYTPAQAITSRKTIRANSSTLTVVFLPWHTASWYRKSLSKRLAKHPTDILIYDFSAHILSFDSKQVMQSFQFIANTIPEEISKLRTDYHYTNVNLIGISLGNVAMCLVADRLREFNQVSMLVPGNSLAQAFWHGRRTQALRQAMARLGKTSDELDTEWAILAPGHYAYLFKAHKVEVLLARQDKFIPYRYGQQLVQQLKEAGAQVSVKQTRFGHVMALLSYWRSL